MCDHLVWDLILSGCFVSRSCSDDIEQFMFGDGLFAGFVVGFPGFRVFLTICAVCSHFCLPVFWKMTLRTALLCRRQICKLSP